MKQRLQCLRFFCCNSSKNGKIAYPTERKTKKEKGSAQFWRSVRPRARGNQNFIDNTGHGQKQLQLRVKTGEFRYSMTLVIVP